MTDSYTSLFKEQLENTEILNLQINKELYYLIDNLILIDAQEKAQLLLNIVARKQTFPIYFLNTITNYLQKNNKKENLKRYIKYISKSIQKIEKTFDEEYLLLKNENKFHLEENLIFLNFVDSLSEILNLYDFNKYADKLFILKNKIDLGFNRYLIHKENIIECFDTQNKKYWLASYFIIFQTLNSYNLEQKKYKKILDEALENINNIKTFELILSILLYLKKTKSKKYKSLKKQFEIYIKYAPEFIYQSKEDIAQYKYTKSLFKNHRENIIELKKEKKVLININSQKIINLILQL